MDKSEYDRYGENPEVAKRRAEVKEAFLKNLNSYVTDPKKIEEAVNRSQINTDALMGELFRSFGLPGAAPLPEGYHGRWGNFSPEDLDFLNDAGIPLRD